jgi:hypothetical protein
MTHSIKRFTGPAYNYTPTDIIKSMPSLGQTSECPDPILYLKFFTPDAQWTWFAAEFDPNDEIFFGLVHGLYEEWGNFSLAELREWRGVLKLPVERDIHWTPRPSSQCS